jgi:hypothetical protein
MNANFRVFGFSREIRGLSGASADRAARLLERGARMPTKWSSRALDSDNRVADGGFTSRVT